MKLCQVIAANAILVGIVTGSAISGRATGSDIYKESFLESSNNIHKADIEGPPIWPSCSKGYLYTGGAVMEHFGSCVLLRQLMIPERGEYNSTSDDIQAIIWRNLGVTLDDAIQYSIPLNYSTEISDLHPTIDDIFGNILGILKSLNTNLLAQHISPSALKSYIGFDPDLGTDISIGKALFGVLAEVAIAGSYGDLNNAINVVRICLRRMPPS
ncbi:hypothetical protein GQ53DRAFT_823752 [Thozetella sp. PMI_491]|nr:hypothetical protein GQ53DRAFT_823752 [Thozetella sp. PMI_491]